MARINRPKSIKRPTRRTPLPYRPRGPLLSRGELAFFRALQAAIANRYLIAIKVRVADLIDCPAAAWNDGFGFMVARHHVDIVLCDPNTTAVLAVIELDDRSHDRPERRRRDEFLNAAFAVAKISLLRFTAAARYQPLVIRERILRTISAARAKGSSENDFHSGKSQTTSANEAPRNRTNKGRWGRRSGGARGKRFPDRLRRPIIVGAKGLPASRGEPRR